MNEIQQNNDSNKNHAEKGDLQDDDKSRQTAKNKRDHITQVSVYANIQSKKGYTTMHITTPTTQDRHF